MAVTLVQDGKIVDTNKTSELAESIAKGKNNGLDKDAFLGLLVAQMKYQDPLEPTSNTEFVSQYATFSELEQMQNMNAAMELSRASGLVGEVVTVNTVDSNGKEAQLQGKVDYVTYENGKAFVSIGGATYSLDDIFAVADQEYLDAYDKAYDLTVALNKLPAKKELLTLDHADVIDELNEIYGGMSEYEKSFMAQTNVTKLKEYTERIEELRKDKEDNTPSEDDGGDGE